jgi:hypothetical protein
MVFNSVAIQLLHTILAEQAEWESRCFIETKAECVNESLKWQSTTLYDADNMFWDDKQAYTQAASMTVADILVSGAVQDQNLFDEITDLEQMWVNAEAEDGHTMSFVE